MRPRLLLPFGLAATLALVAFTTGRPRLRFTPTATHTALLLGSRTIRPATDSDRAGSSEAFRFTAGRSGRATTIMLFVAAGNRSHTVRAAIYASRSGRPSTLLSSGIKRRPTARKWNAVRIRSTRLRAHRVYWIAILGSGGPLAFRDVVSGRCTSQESRVRALHRLPRRWATGRRWPTCRLSAFVVGQVPGAAPPAHRRTPTSPSKPGTGSGTPPSGGNSSPPSFPGTGRNCVSNPSACGYPDATNSGVPAGTALTSSGGFVANQPNRTYSNLDVHGTITVTANNVTILNSRITTGDDSMSSAAITIQSGVTGTRVRHTTMQGSNCQGGSLFAGIMNNSSDDLIMEADYGQCLDDILHGAGIITDSYSIDNANIPGDHYEPIAYDGGGGGITIIHDTLLNPHDQTAAIFVTCYFGPVTSETIKNSLLAGGDYVVYGPEGNGACDGQTGHQDVENNRFSTAYFPKGGQYGTHLYFQDGNTTWSGNVWDDTLQNIPY